MIITQGKEEDQGRDVVVHRGSSSPSFPSSTAGGEALVDTRALVGGEEVPTLVRTCGEAATSSRDLSGGMRARKHGCVAVQRSREVVDGGAKPRDLRRIGGPPRPRRREGGPSRAHLRVEAAGESRRQQSSASLRAASRIGRMVGRINVPESRRRGHAKVTASSENSSRPSPAESQEAGAWSSPPYRR
jgi:hypothetical protein